MSWYKKRKETLDPREQLVDLKEILEPYIDDDYGIKLGIDSYNGAPNLAFGKSNSGSVTLVQFYHGLSGDNFVLSSLTDEGKTILNSAGIDIIDNPPWEGMLRI